MEKNSKLNGKKEFTWLEYSVALNRAFCFYCRAFSENVSKSDEAFTKTGFCNWKKATEKFRSHSTSSVHNTSIIKAKDQLLSPVEELLCS